MGFEGILGGLWEGLRLFNNIKNLKKSLFNEEVYCLTYLMYMCCNLTECVTLVPSKMP
jgi:hypothetical protein